MTDKPHEVLDNHSSSPVLNVSTNLQKVFSAIVTKRFLGSDVFSKEKCSCVAIHVQRFRYSKASMTSIGI